MKFPEIDPKDRSLLLTALCLLALVAAETVAIVAILYTLVTQGGR